MKDYGDVVQWLLEENAPHVRYNTLRHILRRPLDDAKVIESRERMMESPSVSKILAKQNPDGGFLQKSFVKRLGIDSARAGYSPRHRATTWQAVFLAQAGLSGDDPRIRALGEYILENSFSEELGAFGWTVELKTGSRLERIPCFIGNMVHALCSFGFGDDHRVRNSFEFLVRHQRFDDGGYKPKKEWPHFGRQDRCWGGHTCYWGVTKLIRAMTVVPDSYWTNEAMEAKRKSVEFVLIHRIMWSSRNPTRPMITGRNDPRILEAPLSYHDDVIEIATMLLRLGVDDPSIDEAIEYILSKRNERGRWLLEATPSNMYVTWGKIGDESKWITFRAIRLLALAGRLDDL
jgi:hypothetical protein